MLDYQFQIGPSYFWYTADQFALMSYNMCFASFHFFFSLYYNYMISSFPFLLPKPPVYSFTPLFDVVFISLLQQKVSFGSGKEL